MGRFFLERGLVIQREGRTYELHHRTDTALYFEDPQTRDIEKITEEEFWRQHQTQELVIVAAKSNSRELTVPPSEANRSERVVSEKQTAAELRRTEYQEGMVKRGVTRGQLGAIEKTIPEIAEEIGDKNPPGASTVACWMRQVDSSDGGERPLLSKKALGESHDGKTFAHDEVIHAVVADHLKPGVSYKSLYQYHYKPAIQVVNEGRRKVAELPLVPLSYRSLCRHVGEMEPYELDCLRLGTQEAERKYRMIRGHMPAKHPLDYAEIDHAHLRLWVIDDILMLPLGRPWVTAIRDRKTRMLLGFYVTFRPPSLASTFGALRHSLTPHLDLRSLWPDLEHDWTAFGLANIYVSDRGADFTSPQYRAAVRNLGANYEYCEKRTPWHKPYIERLFHEIYADLLESTRGRVYRGLSYTRDYNPKRDAVVRFSTLIYLLVKWAVDYAPFRKLPAGGRPIDLWAEGIGDAPPAHCDNPDALNITLGLRRTGRLGHEGIRFKHLRYANDELRDLLRSSRERDVQFVVTESNLGRIFVEHPKEKRWREVECTRPDYAEGLSLFQHQSITRQANAKNDAIDDVDQLLRVRQQLQTRVADDLVAKESAAKLKIARYAGINSTSVMDGRAKSVADMIANPTAATLSPTEPPAASNDSAFVDVPSFSWRSR
jgi:putative transposase